MRKLLLISLFLSFNTFAKGSIEWISQCSDFREDIFKATLKKKCLDKKCKMKIDTSSELGLSGKTKDYKYQVLPGRKMIKTEFSDRMTLGSWSKVVAMFCPKLDSSKFANLKIKSLPNRGKLDVYHLEKRSYKDSSIYKEFSKSPDPCVKLVVKESKSAAVLYLAPKNVSKSCFPMPK